MNRIMEYEVCVDTSAQALKIKVDDKIKDGYQPIGGVSVSNGEFHGTAIFAQALIKDGDNNGNKFKRN